MGRAAPVVLMMAGAAGLAGAGPAMFGVQAHSMMGGGERHRDSVALMAELGVTMLRDECHWSLVEREHGVLEVPGVWNRSLDEALERGVEVLLILNYMNAHHDGGVAPHTDEGRAAFARYAARMARETRGRVRHFEIWNEPNTAGFWPPEPNAADYAALVRAAAPAIRAENPEAVVIGGVTSGIAGEFWRGVFAAGGGEFLDAISIHPYITPDAPEPRGTWEEMRAIHEMSGGLPVWITEFGYPTAGVNSVSEERQADMVARTYLGALVRPWVERTFYYWFGPDGDDAELNEDNFGLVRHDGSRKPAFAALQTITRLFASAEHRESLRLGEQIEAHVFTVPASGEADTLTAAWTWEDVRHWRVTTDETVRVIARDGDAVTLHPVEGTVWVSLSGSPVYLLTRGTPRLEAATAEAISLDEVDIPISSFTWLDLHAAFPAPLRFSALGGFPVRVHTYFDQPRSRWGINPNVFLQPIRPGRYRLSAVGHAIETGQPAARLVTAVQVIHSAEVTLAPAATREGAVVATVTNRMPGNLRGRLTVAAWPSGEVSPESVVVDALRPGAVHREEFAIGGALAADAVLHASAELVIGGVERIEATRAISFLTSPRAASSPEIDGDLSDWRGHAGAPIRLGAPGQSLSPWGTWEGPEDASARVWTAWDGAWFYLAAEVVDDVIADAVTGHEIYKSDGIEVYFDADLFGDLESRQHSDDDSQYGAFLQQGSSAVFAWSRLNDYSPGGRIADNRAVTAEQTISGEPCAYVIEAAIPLEEIRLTPRDGLVIGFNCGLTDDDDPSRVHPFGQDIQMMWSRRRLSWQNPQSFAQLRLVE